MTDMRRSRIAVLAATAALVVAGGAVATWALLKGPGPECTVPRPDPVTGAQAPLALRAVQLQHASTIDAVGLARGLPERARIIAIATAWQESSLRNIDHGDLDSLGLFQQRASQGWGEAAQLMDPIYAAGQFYDHLLKVPHWQDISLTRAAQAVQRSGFPDAYAKWEADAAALARQLGGTVPVALTCRAGAAASTADAPTRPEVPGLVGAAPALADLVASAQAELTGITVDSVSRDGRTATLAIALPNVPADQAGRALAAWSVAHATSMGVDTVRVADQKWRGHRWSEQRDALSAGSVTIALAS